ncbi:glycosyltransferase [Cyclobacterium sp. 1_MG-2023]|uniref:glycosyltransferase n=1 Tax=Cyclobacterium sp. 1_MG-2023 TaxID=3062681 RepID=UPI0026E3E773|nr:glycosyltransferase [Cyclobacterium sp. 1_MG-2023]MDO6439319.1 glycosyltransferase [Cyclobacterium sp. 1_MG-2023]
MEDFSNLTLDKVTIVMTSMSRWDGEFSSASWSLAKTFAHSQKVIYVDYPFTLLDYFKERKKPSVAARKTALIWGKGSLKTLTQYSPLLYALTPPLMLPINWLPPGAMYDFFSNWNDKRLANSINRAVKELKEENFIFFNSFNPLYLTKLPNGFKPRAFVYQSRDNIRALEPYLRKHGAGKEIEAVKNADLSLVTSRMLQKDLESLSGKNVAYFPNAADFDLFRTAYDSQVEIPEDIKTIPKPIIGYTGNICHRLDYDLIESICKANPDKSIVMVGPRNHQGHTSIDLDKIPNLFFTGPKKIEELPHYLAHFQILILPFLCNEVTKSIYPLKINEYLASGKPIVATPFSEDIQSFHPLISLEKTPANFNEAIEIELNSDSVQKAKSRYVEASKNTWKGRVKLFWELLVG